MALYKYSAADMNGKITKGRAEASDPSRLKELILEKNGLFLVEFEEEQKSFHGKRLKASELSDFCREIGSMLGAGITLVRALSIISARSADTKLKNIYDGLNTQIKRGTPLSSAMLSMGRTFPELLINMILSGEESGQLPKVCLKMAEHYEKEHRLSQQIKGALTYPIILVVMTLLVIIGIFTFILPSFMKLFQDMEVPLITQILMDFSSALRDYWYLFCIGGAAAVLIIWSALRTEKVRIALDKLKLSFPVTGRLVKIICTARFARTLSSLYAGGLSILSSLNVAKSTVGNKYIESQFSEAIRLVKGGNPLSDALAAVDGFDVKLIQTVAVGEETGKLDSLLEAVADSFEYEASAAVKKLVTIIEPVMICIMALVIVTVVLAVMLPIYSLYSEIDNTTLL